MKFFFGEVISFISDTAGRLAEFAKKTDVTGGLSTWVGNRLKTQTTIIGKDGAYEADVLLRDGITYLQTFGIQAIESLRGFDPQADTWFYIGTETDSTGVGNAGDEIRIIIEAGDDPVNYPKIDITYTLTAGDALGTEDDLALAISAYLNLQTPFKELWRSQRVQGNGVIYISARKPGGQYERPNLDDFKVTSTGTTVVTRAFDRIIRQNKITGLARDPADPRQGQLGIQGSVTQSEGDVTNRFQIVYPDANIRGDITPVDFEVTADPTEVEFVTSVSISGRDNGIQFSNFLGQNGPLNTGIVVSFKSNDVVVSREPIKTTDDFLDFHAEDPDNFEVFFASGADKFTAVLNFSVPLEIRPQGEFILDDYLKVTINDDLRSITQLRIIINGFNREF